MVLRLWSLHWMRSLGAVAKVADLAAEKTVPLLCRTKKWRNLTSSLRKRKAEYHLQGTLALSACLYSMFCFRFLREVQVFCEQINAVLRSTKHIRALLFLDILNLESKASKETGPHRGSISAVSGALLGMHK